MKLKKTISIIGSTGSVGSYAFKVAKENKDYLHVESLVAKDNYIKLSQQARILNVDKVFIENEKHYKNLCNELSGLDIEVFAGKQSIIDFIESDTPTETLLISSSGYDSIPYFFGALKTNKYIAIANKESIVCGGSFSSKSIKASKAHVIPVDSEHSSLYQLMLGCNKEDIKSILITASGGPFVDHSLAELKYVSIEEALEHPTWKMGKKITIDSATLVNKALEVIEAAYLFDMKQSQIETIVHRQSILHGGIHYIDGSFIGHYSFPSMEIPVSYGLFYPHKVKTSLNNLNLSKDMNLSFETLDEERFSAIKIAREVLDKGYNYSCIFNMSNEIAVKSFLDNKISFYKIIDVIKYALDKITSFEIKCTSDIHETARISKSISLDYVKKLNNK